MRLSKSIIAAIALLVSGAVAGCGDDADGGEAGATDNGPLAPDELRDKVAEVTGCSPFEEIEPYGDSVAVAEYICGTEPSDTSYLFVYDTNGSLQADLAGQSTDVKAGTNAAVVGDTWIYYTFSKTGLAAMLDYGGTLHRSMDPNYAQ